MALSKPERISKVEGDVEITIPMHKNFDFCKVSYSKAVSVEIIDHLLCGQNMDYKAMELENSHQCFAVCRCDVLEILKNDKRQIMFFEDRKSDTSDILAVIVEQPRTSKHREHIILYCVIRLAIRGTPIVGFVRYFNLTGQDFFFFNNIIKCHKIRYEKLTYIVFGDFLCS